MYGAKKSLLVEEKVKKGYCFLCRKCDWNVEELDATVLKLVEANFDVHVRWFEISLLVDQLANVRYS